jgi:hypothetical protein
VEGLCHKKRKKANEKTGKSVRMNSEKDYKLSVKRINQERKCERRESEKEKERDIFLFRRILENKFEIRSKRKISFPFGRTNILWESKIA